jgi:hypothetical protein
LFRQTTLFDEGLGYPNTARVADGYEGRFHVIMVDTL